MKSKIFSIAILILLYALAIKDAMVLSYVSGAEFSIFVENISPSLILPIVLIQSVFALMIFGIQIALIKNFIKESPPTKPKFSLIIGTSITFPVLIIINNYIAGVFLYSFALLIGGLIFTSIFTVLYFNGIERSPLPRSVIEKENVMEGICFFINEWEYFRFPVNMGITPYPLFLQLKSQTNIIAKQAFAKKYPKVYSKIIDDLDPFFKNAMYSKLYNPSPEEYFLRYGLRYNFNLHRLSGYETHFDSNLTEMNGGFAIMNCFGLSLFSIFIIFKLIPFEVKVNYMSVVFLICFLIFYMGFSVMSTNRRKKWAKKCNPLLTKSIQELIDCGVDYIKENDLNPENFPIKIRHNDYSNLEYEKKGENSFVGYFMIN